MLLQLLGFEDAGEVRFRYDLPPAVMAGLLAAAAAYAVWLYGRHRVLTPLRRYALAGLRGLAYAAILLILFEPVAVISRTIDLPANILVLLDASESMSVSDPRSRTADIEDAAIALGRLPLPENPGAAPRTVDTATQAEAVAARRIDIAKGVLQLPELKILREPEKVYTVRNFTFGERLDPAQEKPDWAAAAKAESPSTRLGEAVREAVERYGGQSITGVVLLTDGGNNEGVDPAEAAARLKERGVPLHVVGVGLAEPDDVSIGALLAADTAFVKDRVPVRVRIDSRGFNGRTVELTASLDGRPVARKTVELIGGPQIEELSFLAEGKDGRPQLSVTVSELPGEANARNNSASRPIRIIDKKIKVLYVEGRPRWEYRYLRAVLLRDHRLEVKFLLTEGDRDLARADPEHHVARLPDDASAFEFDLIILGEVPAGYFSAAQLARIEELVRGKEGVPGASLLMLAGPRHAPASYRDTPVGGLLPVKIAPAGREPLDERIHPVATQAGSESLITSLDPDAGRNADLWSMVHPLYDVPRLDGAKPGATVLATLSDKARRTEEHPLIAWQRYGSGKTMYVGTDQLWRLRFKRGDELHARFWGQAIQFLTLSRLLNENKRIRIETDRNTGRTGERIQIYANVLDEGSEPVKADSHVVFVQCPGEAEPRAVRLEPVPGSAGLFQGFFTPDRGGRHQISSGTVGAGAGNVVELDVSAVSRELLDTAMREGLLRKMAELSGGRYFTVRELGALPELLEAKPRTMTVQEEKTLWDHWWVIAVIVACLGTEWFFRRRYDVS